MSLEDYSTLPAQAVLAADKLRRVFFMGATVSGNEPGRFLRDWDCSESALARANADDLLNLSRQIA